MTGTHPAAAPNHHEATPPVQVERFSTARIPTAHGEFTAHVYRDTHGIEHIAVVAGDPAAGVPLVRLHSECLTGDILGSTRCDCGSQLDAAMAAIADAGCGVIVYLRGHEGRGIGLGHKLRAYALQDEGLDTVDANLALGFPTDARDFAVGAAVLADLGVRRAQLLTNNPVKEAALAAAGIEVARVPLLGTTTAENVRYLQTKRERMGHLLDDDTPDTDPGDLGAAGALV